MQTHLELYIQDPKGLQQRNQKLHQTHQDASKGQGLWLFNRMPSTYVAVTVVQPSVPSVLVSRDLSGLSLLHRGACVDVRGRDRMMLE